MCLATRKFLDTLGEGLATHPRTDTLAKRLPGVGRRTAQPRNRPDVSPVSGVLAGRLPKFGTQIPQSYADFVHSLNVPSAQERTLSEHVSMVPY